MNSKSSLLWLMVALTLLAAALRFYRLDVVPLRGDEAFSVMAWAQPPGAVWSDLAGWEPHPIGTFVTFWAWKSIAGDSEFAMRTLPLLFNLIGVALMMVLARRTIRKRGAAWMAGLLWALNPFQVWHSQDVRNYSIWSALSLLAFCLFLLAVRRNRPRDWALYGIAQTIACYAFLLEPFFMLVQLIYLLLFFRQKAILRNLMFIWTAIAIALSPLLIQLTRLADSDYPGTASKVSLEALIRDFVPTLLFGESRLSLFAGAALLLVLIAGLITGAKRTQSDRVLLGLWLFLPLILLMLLGTRLSVFLPRYVIPITAPLLLVLLRIAYRAKFIPALMTGTLAAVSLLSLYAYFYTDPPKAMDWRSLVAFLHSRTEPGDLIITSSIDPAFPYYYQGEAAQAPWLEIHEPAALLTDYDAIFMQTGTSTFDIGLYLQDTAQFIPPATAMIKQYRSYEVDPAEIQHPLDIRMGEVAQLRGYSLVGGDEFGLTILLYWQPLQRTAQDFTAFVHVIGAPDAVTGSPLRDSDDHIPLNGDASTTLWNPGDLLRDPFVVNVDSGIYTLVIGMYESATVENVPIYDADGNLLGDSYPLQEIEIKGGK